jgi:hypothetical protein
MEKEAATHFDVIWNFDNSRFFDMDCFENSFRIHHRMDFHYNFQNERTCKSANLCLGVTAGIVDSMKIFNKESHFINHGYATPEISHVKLPSRDEPFKALYIGNLFSPFINWEWIHALVKKKQKFISISQAALAEATFAMTSMKTHCTKLTFSAKKERDISGRKNTHPRFMHI